MIGTGCGRTTDHFARSGVTGKGASAICGIPASLATLETAIVGGVVDDARMISAFDSVTKRRAFVVALVGSPPSSRTITLSGVPAISFGTNSSALRSGIPSAAAGPVVEMDMPMVISLVCAAAGTAVNANEAAATAASDENVLMNSSLGNLLGNFPCSLQSRSDRLILMVFTNEIRQISPAGISQPFPPALEPISIGLDPWDR